jgi:double-stranded uracil-DNA glycosylase
MVESRLSPQARILFVGINPHYGSYQRGVPFSNNKTFWYLLNEAGLLHEKREDLKNDQYLKTLYDTTFVTRYHLNFINIIDRPTRETTTLRHGEEQPGKERLSRAIQRYRPRVVCFVGKITYQKFTGRPHIEYGWQQDLFDSKVFVMHFPIRGKASVRIHELHTIQAAAET